MILVKSYIDVKTRGLIALQLVRIEQTKKCSQIVGPFLDLDVPSVSCLDLDVPSVSCLAEFALVFSTK